MEKSTFCKCGCCKSKRIKHKPTSESPTKIAYIIGPQGPTGPTGPAGVDVVARNTETIPPDRQASVISSHEGNTTLLDFYIPKGEKGDCPTIKAGITTTVSPSSPAQVIERFADNTYFLDFNIPKGERGERGEQGKRGERGEKGEQGNIGPQGPRGEKGESETITIDEVETVPFNEPAQVIDTKEGNIHHLEFFIPQGPKGNTGATGLQGPRGEKGDAGEKGERGEQGPPGPLDIPCAFILSYNDDPNTFPPEGKEIASNSRLPLMRLELENGGIINLNTNDNTIQFNKTGVYKIVFTVNAYIKNSTPDFDPSTDFVAIAFREIDSDNILAGVNSWTPDECATNMTGQGIFTVPDIATAYELINTQKKSIYINGCNIMKTISQSYFSVPMVSITIQKLK